MKIEAITQTKLYELAIQHKQHQEDIRDNINSYLINYDKCHETTIHFNFQEIYYQKYI